METLKHVGLDFDNCQVQAYDNGTNMSGAYKGCQALLARMYQCPSSILKLQLSHFEFGVNSAECCPDAITFFDALEKLFTRFSSSLQRWNILQGEMDTSLH